MRIRELAREPLVHFLVIGAGLFLIGRATRDGPGAGTNRIVVTEARIEQLAAAFAQTWQRPPTERELERLIEDHVREEVYYREAQALGLDRDDVIIRRRLRQKMEFLSEDLADAAAPTDEELRRYLRANAARYAIEPRLTFEQVYINEDRRGADAERDAQRLIVRLTSGSVPDPAALGDRSLLPYALENASTSEIARVFGEEFADRLAEVEPGEWSGPIRSGYGQHLVRVRERVDGRTPALDEVRSLVERDWRSAKRREVNDAVYERLRGQYTVIIERPGSESMDGD